MRPLCPRAQPLSSGHSHRARDYEGFRRLGIVHIDLLPFMADQQLKTTGEQPQTSPNHRGHPLPRRTSPGNSVTLRHHRLARDASLKAQGLSTKLGVAEPSASNPPRRNSSGDSAETRQSDAKHWFNRSNQNPTATYDDPSNMDVDPPFFQNETDSSNEIDYSGLPINAFGQGDRVPPRLRPAVTQSSSADDYRSVIDDLTIENKRLKEELKRYKQFGPDMMKKEKLFEIKVHGLPAGRRGSWKLHFATSLLALAIPASRPRNGVTLGDIFRGFIPARVCRSMPRPLRLIPGLSIRRMRLCLLQVRALQLRSHQSVALLCTRERHLGLGPSLQTRKWSVTWRIHQGACSRGALS